MEKIPFKTKLVDTIDRAPFGRIDQYWLKEIISNVFKGKRPSALDSNFKFYDPYYLIDQFGLRGFEFGNWLNQEDRYIYLAGAAYAMKDYCECLDIKNAYFGLNGRINIAFGARGKGKSLAHFEPQSWAINLTRYREDNKGPDKFFSASGAGSFGHEYAHALDYFAGRHIDKNSNYNFASEILSEVFIRSGKIDGRAAYKISPLYTKPNINPVRLCMINGLGAIMYTKKSEDTFIDSDFYHNLKQELKNYIGYGDYWQRIIEIYARSYEVFLSKRCEEKGIEESYLKKKKYTSFLYPSKDLFTPQVQKAFIDFSKIVTSSAASK